VRSASSGASSFAWLRTDPGTVISTIAQVTFYGHDQTGRNVSVSGQLNVNFSNYGD